ncbi:MAG TPA: hybrid sensor histidine kinase/response regulator [Candidatus Kryptonia bacterium]|nr:hybrid sensor histidine kinase/response regulator [Candidatus Kryptonia bacterium]
MVPHTVLVVDDEPASLRAVQRALAGHYRVVTANSAAEGLQVLADQPVAMVIADHRMPEMTGTEFLARATTLYPDAIRVLLTGYTDVETVIGAINAGHVYSYLSKPWEPRELQLAVRRGFERYEADVERRRLLHELEQACARARREAEQKGRLLTLAAHELGTPLHVLLNALELIAMLDLPPRPREWLCTARRNGEWLGRGLAQMSAAARVHGDGIRLRLGPVQLAALWASLRVEVDARAASRAVTLVEKIPPDLPAVEADERWLRQAIASLLSNAIRFTPDGGSVTASAHVDREAGHIELAVRDTGIGIEPALLDQVFEPFSAAGGDPFQHASGSLAFGSRGLGLGLAVARAVVTLHGGQLHADSTPQRGSCFTMRLPLLGPAASGANFK